MATETDKVNTGALGTLIAVGLFATLSIALAVTALVRYSARGVSDQRQSLAHQGYLDLHKAQTDKLSAVPAWTDKGQGKVSIPIERAKSRVLAELARDPSSATPPAPAPAPSAAATGAGVVTGENASPTPAAPAPSATHAALEPAAPAPKPTDG
jgi:hypothetical protein